MRVPGSQRLSPTVLVGLALALGAVFKLSAFARESFIASQFGLSAVTDAYFGLQQFPLTVATFMFGAFALAFTPAYADARRASQSVAWMPGLVLYGCAAGSVLTLLTVAGGSFLLRAIHITGSRDVWSTLTILSVCYIPVICIGIWAGICTARGHSTWAMTVSGLPYLIMTLTLFGLYAVKRLNNLSLPISMTAGFFLLGVWSLVCILRSQPFSAAAGPVFSVWNLPSFQHFLKQLSASSVENGGFAANQFLMLYFLSRIGTGVLSANTCAMRIGMLGYSLLAPLAQVMQARLCAAEEKDRAAEFKSMILIVTGVVLALALALFAMRVPVLRVAYMHGKFKGAELSAVANIVPAWIGFFVVASINAVTARYLFIRSQGAIYVRRQLYAYAAANILRFAFEGASGVSWIIWCSVCTEAISLVLNIRTCFADVSPREMIPVLVAPREAL